MATPSAPTLTQRLQGKRVGVVLSAGYFGFFAHAGFLAALEECGVEVHSFAGTSAGGLVSAMAASGMSATQIAERLCAVERRDFWDPDPFGALAGALRGWGATGLLKGERFRALLEASLPAKSIEACRTPLLLVAANLSRGTAQGFTRGELASRVHATCAYPGLFRAAEVDGELFWDGGLVDKAPVLALHEAFKPEVVVVHYLPSRAQDGQPRGPLAYAGAMASAVTALRQDHFDLQLEVLRRSRVPVAVVSSRLPRLGPGSLSRGRSVIEEAKRMAIEALRGPAQDVV